jgi:hypothetical protein
MPGIKEVQVQSTSFLSADRFSLRAALTGAGATVWSDVPLVIELGIGIAGSQTSLITGKADSVSIDPIRGECRIAGRDFAASFVSSQVDQSFENQTSSDIAIALAQKHGLQSQVTATQTPVGRYYQNSRTRTAMTQHARATTEWDLLCWLAQIEGFDVWVQGYSLFFQPVDQSTPIVTVQPGDCLAMVLHHALDVAGGVAVTVKSWDCINQTMVSQVVSGGSSEAGLMNRTIVRPNLSSNDAQRLALQTFSQITEHERHIEMEMPGDLVIQPRNTISVQATGTDFDGLYNICSIERRLSFTHGFTQTVEAKSFPWTPS